jgi:hypothetical protein
MMMMKTTTMMTMTTTVLMTIPHQRHQQPGHDNNELAIHLKRLQVVPQFGWMVCGGQQDYNQFLGPYMRMGDDDPPDFCNQDKTAGNF